MENLKASELNEKVKETNSNAFSSIKKELIPKLFENIYEGRK